MTFKTWSVSFSDGPGETLTMMFQKHQQSDQLVMFLWRLERWQRHKALYTHFTLGGQERAHLQRDAGSTDPTTQTPRTAADVPGEFCVRDIITFPQLSSPVPVWVTSDQLFFFFFNAPAVKMMYHFHYFSFLCCQQTEEICWGDF